MIPSRQAYIRVVSSATEKNMENTQSPAPPISTKDGASGYPIPIATLDRPVQLHEPHVLRNILTLIVVPVRLILPVATGTPLTEQIRRRGTEQTGLDRIPPQRHPPR